MRNGSLFKDLIFLDREEEIMKRRSDFIFLTLLDIFLQIFKVESLSNPLVVI